ncbi:MAG TPA: SAM hydroxide adenosyltransferase, partial [Trebonia sp.]|nr:SAM hydroxide adenosyltransferase [Trebonia sp.]
FMPVAAHLAAGVPLAQAGGQLDVASLVTLPRPASRITRGRIDAEVLTVDRFGNAQLSVTGPEAARAGLASGTTATLAWDSRELTVPFGSTFGDVTAGELVCFQDSAGYVAIAVNGGNAAQRLGLHPETLVTLTVTK